MPDGTIGEFPGLTVPGGSIGATGGSEAGAGGSGGATGKLGKSGCALPDETTAKLKRAAAEHFQNWAMSLFIGLILKKLLPQVKVASLALLLASINTKLNMQVNFYSTRRR